MVVTVVIVVMVVMVIVESMVIIIFVYGRDGRVGDSRVYYHGRRIIMVIIVSSVSPAALES